MEAIESVWLPTDQQHDFSQFQGLLCSPGSPYHSMDGALAGLRYARENRVRFLGTCGGFRHLVIEYARNIMGFSEAAHAETDPGASCLFITPLSCSLVGKTMEVAIKPGSGAAHAYRAVRSKERFYCNFGLNPQYQRELERARLQITGTDAGRRGAHHRTALAPTLCGHALVPQARSAKGSPIRWFSNSAGLPQRARDRQRANGF